MNVDSSKVIDQYEEDEEEEEKEKPKTITAVSKFHGWNNNSSNSSRIFRVSRATGGKDRHSKVLTSKGLRDRRVRLSVSTAIAFYDLQDRLGYDQPSKAVEWLIKASEEAISELPVLDTSFSTDATFKMQVNCDDDDFRMDRDLLNPNSETSKGCSRLSSSLSRPESRVRARERAREIKAAKEKEREKENELIIGDLPNRVANTQNQTLISQNASFTELLTNGLFGLSRTATSSQDYSAQSMTMSPFSVTGDDRQQHRHQSSEMQQYSPEMQHYDLNFRMSSSSSGFNNRGTLQSNLSVPSLFPQFEQRFSASVDGSSNNVPFYMGAMAAPSASASSENNSGSHHHYSQFDSGFDERLHLFHGDGTPHSDHKGKRKN